MATLTALKFSEPEGAKAMLEKDFLKSKEVKEDELEGRSFWFRLAVRLAGLTAPIQ